MPRTGFPIILPAYGREARHRKLDARSVPRTRGGCDVQEHRHGACHPIGRLAGVHLRRRRGFRKCADQIHEGGLGPDMDRLVAYTPSAFGILFDQQAALGRDASCHSELAGLRGIGSAAAGPPSERVRGATIAAANRSRTAGNISGMSLATSCFVIPGRIRGS